MTIKVFGELQDIICEENIDVSGAEDLHSLKEKLYQLYPQLRQKKFAVAVNKNMVNENILLEKMDEIALLPPFSGG